MTKGYVLNGKSGTQQHHNAYLLSSLYHSNSGLGTAATSHWRTPIWPTWVSELLAFSMAGGSKDSITTVNLVLLLSSINERHIMDLNVVKTTGRYKTHKARRNRSRPPQKKLTYSWRQHWHIWRPVWPRHCWLCIRSGPPGSSWSLIYPGTPPHLENPLWGNTEREKERVNGGHRENRIASRKSGTMMFNGALNPSLLSISLISKWMLDQMFECSITWTYLKQQFP